MRAADSSPEGAPSWLTPHGEQSSLRRYAETIRERWWLIVLCVVLATAVGAAYVSITEKVYEANADLLVTPVPSGDDATMGLGLIRESNDPSRDVSTVSRFVSSVPVARRVKQTLGSRETPNELLERITAEPVAQSSVVTVGAEAPTAGAAAALANAFAEETVRLRTAQLRRQLDFTVPALRARLEQLPPGERDSD